MITEQTKQIKQTKVKVKILPPFLKGEKKKVTIRPKNKLLCKDVNIVIEEIWNEVFNKSNKKNSIKNNLIPKKENNLGRVWTF